jgi:hypothetical protein
MGLKKNDFVTRYLRGDDSLLNAGSSAERRYLEGVLLTVGISSVWSALAEGDSTTVGLDANFSLEAGRAMPKMLSNGAGDWARDWGKIIGNVPIMGGLWQGESNAAGGLLDKLPGGNGFDFAPSVDADLSATVPIRDLVIMALTAGYVLEKSQEHVKAIGIAAAQAIGPGGVVDRYTLDADETAGALGGAV